MTDKPESQQQDQQKPQGVQTRKKAPAQPSFEDILAGRPAEPPKPPPPPQKSELPRPPPQPSFDEILAKAAPAPAADDKGAADEGKKERGPRPPKRERDPRKGPIVVRKMPIGKAAEGEAAGARGAQAPGEQTSEQAAASAEARKGSESSGEGAQRRPQRPPQPLAESVYATPTAEEDQDFAALFAESGAAARPGKLKQGQRLTARVAHLGAEVAFLDLGGKGEGIIDLRELRNDKGELLVHAGETIDGYVLSLGSPESGVVITRSIPKGAGREHLHAALEARLPVEGTVTGQNKGGLEVDLGGLRAFVPASQVDVRFVEDQSQFVGQKLKFLVMELRGANAILSRRALLEEERKSQAAELRKKLEVGATLEGTITGVRDFGAFVDLGGLEGLIHVSELSHQRVAHAQDAVKVGQKVRVQVLRLDPPGKDDKSGQERIALSLRALEQDPWDAHVAELHEGKKLQGKVARLQPFGAFVELFPGVDGLVHVSALANKHVNHPREVVKEGETIWVQVESVDPGNRRVALRRITEEEAQSAEPVPAPQRGGRERDGGRERAEPGAAQKRARVGDVVEATVDRCEVYGVFVRWEGATAGKGLVPNPELGTPRGSDNKKVMPVGTKFKAAIIDLDNQGRYRLSKVAAEAAQDRAEMEEYRRSQKQPAGKGFGTLGDLLRAKLGK